MYAHRGLHDGNRALENSRRAVEEALVSTADGLEVDLQCLADGRFLLHHDGDLNPEHFDVPRPVPVATRTLDEIRRLSNIDRLSLSDVLELDWNEKTLVFECKASRNRTSFARALERVFSERTIPETLLFSSQDPRLLDELRHRFRGTSLAPVLSHLNPLDRHRAGDARWSEIHLAQDLCTANTLDPTDELDPDRVVAWTVNDPERGQKLERIGIKGIMTDNSDLFP